MKIKRWLESTPRAFPDSHQLLTEKQRPSATGSRPSISDATASASMSPVCPPKPRLPLYTPVVANPVGESHTTKRIPGQEMGLPFVLAKSTSLRIGMGHKHRPYCRHDDVRHTRASPALPPEGQRGQGHQNRGPPAGVAVLGLGILRWERGKGSGKGGKGGWPNLSPRHGTSIARLIIIWILIAISGSAH